MKSSPARAAAVTGGLLVAGGLLGAIAAVIGAAIAVAVTHGLPEAISWPILGGAAIIGAVLGAPLLPATSFLLLRRVPLGVSFVGTTAGTVVGGVLGWIVAVTGQGDPITWPIGAALIGFFAAVIILRRKFSAPIEGERVRVPGAGA